MQSTLRLNCKEARLILVEMRVVEDALVPVLREEGAGDKHEARQVRGGAAECLLLAPIAVCMGQHSRLGINLPFFRLDEYITALIIDLSFDGAQSSWVLCHRHAEERTRSAVPRGKRGGWKGGLSIQSSSCTVPPRQNQRRWRQQSLGNKAP